MDINNEENAPWVDRLIAIIVGMSGDYVAPRTRRNARLHGPCSSVLLLGRRNKRL